MSDDKDRQTFTAIESTFTTTLPKPEPLWIRDGVSIVGERLALTEPTRYPLRAPWHPDEGEVYAAGFWLPYCANNEEASQHVADFYWTKITPGADPRARWETDRIARLAVEAAPRVLEVGDRARPAPVLVLTASRRDDYRYVPLDVCRWRDSAHRDELTRRAREYADCAQRLVDR